MNLRRCAILLVAFALLQSIEAGPVQSAEPAKALADALSPAKWSQVEDSVDRALAWLSTQQEADGSFPTYASGQPAITSLCVMAFLSRGHRPGFGPYGEQLNRAIDYVLSCQKDDGLICLQTPSPVFANEEAPHTATYNHAISGLMLGEVYGHVTGGRAKKVKAAIGKAILLTRHLQTRQKTVTTDIGGVRYVILRSPGDNDADLSVTAWHLMFLRSAKNAEFRVPENFMQEGADYVRRCWDPNSQMFFYAVPPDGGRSPSRGMTGAGVVCLSMAGQHNTPMAQQAGDWLVANRYQYPGETIGDWDRFYYSAYYCSQAAAQLGGRYWTEIFPPLVNVLLQSQAPNGFFRIDPPQRDVMFGKCYSTPLAVLALTPAYQLLPVFQR